ncbi:MAG: hypothetical protein U0L05_06250 [Schaedlerella sp.]|nr:hypothetical protein [Schaedlerella sp.]
MKDERWKVNVCLITIVLAAVIIGLFYYSADENQMNETGGVLVNLEQEEKDVC